MCLCNDVKDVQNLKKYAKCTKKTVLWYFPRCLTTVSLWRCAPYRSFPLGSFLKDCSMPRERGEKSWMTVSEIKANHIEDCVVESAASRSRERIIPTVQHWCLVSCFLTVWKFPADYRQKTIQWIATIWMEGWAHKKMNKLGFFNLKKGSLISYDH